MGGGWGWCATQHGSYNTPASARPSLLKPPGGDGREWQRDSKGGGGAGGELVGGGVSVVKSQDDERRDKNKNLLDGPSAAAER